MKRRDFLRTLNGASLAVMASRHPLQAMAASADADSIRSLFEWRNPDVIELTETVYRNCILGKVFPPEGTLKQQWIGPGGGYKGQWIWDTMFVVDLLSILPGTKQLIRDVFQNYWDFQKRWNAQMPACAHDMVPCMIEPHKGQLARISSLFSNSDSCLGRRTSLQAQWRQGTAETSSRTDREIP